MIAHDFGMILAHCVAGTELFSPRSDVKNDPFFTESEVQLALRSVHRVAERLGVRRPRVPDVRRKARQTSQAEISTRLALLGSVDLLAGRRRRWESSVLKL